jgi:hypothetical protein
MEYHRKGMVNSAGSVKKNVKNRPLENSALTATTRVTRLGKFSPSGQFITRVNFSKIKEAAEIAGLLFSAVKIVHQF